MIKRFCVLFLLAVNLQVETESNMLIVTSTTMIAQHMDLEGGNYDCEDEVLGYYRSVIPCDGVIVPPNGNKSECMYCHNEVYVEDLIDHEYNCPERKRFEEDPFYDNNQGSSNTSSNTSGSSTGNGGTSNSTNSSSTYSSTSGLTNNQRPLSATVFPDLPRTTPIGKVGAAMAGLVYNDNDYGQYLNYLRVIRHFE